MLNSFDTTLQFFRIFLQEPLRKKLICIQKLQIYVFFEKMNCVESQLNHPLYATETLHKKQSFPLRISPVNLIKSAVSYGFDHIF